MTMKVLAFNGSPRKKWNTATMLENALQGAAAEGARTELIHLYDYSFKGCVSCFSCKKIDGRSYGKCAVQDEMTPLLEKVDRADALLLGSPVYFATESAQLRLFMERLLFPKFVYSRETLTLFARKIPTALILTMNVNEEQFVQFGFKPHFDMTKLVMTRVFGSAEVLLATDTYQFKDYAQYESSLYDPDHKARRRREEFPRDCERARDLGVRLARKQSTE